MKHLLALLLLLPLLALGQVTTNPGVTGVVGTGTTGSGNVVLQTSPTLTTPFIGVAGATSVNLPTATPTGSETSHILSVYSEGTWTPSPVSLTVVGTPTYTGKYVRIGRFVHITLYVSSTTTTQSTAVTTNFTGLPWAADAYGGNGSCSNASSAASYGGGSLLASTMYMPTWAAVANVVCTYTYQM